MVRTNTVSNGNLSIWHQKQKGFVLLMDWLADNIVIAVWWSLE
jgi:hypothetical protein